MENYIRQAEPSQYGTENLNTLLLKRIYVPQIIPYYVMKHSTKFGDTESETHPRNVAFCPQLPGSI